MASLSLGGSHGTRVRRALDLEIQLVPFIDFLLCLVAFLLVTAVWSQMARLDADARVPGKPDDTVDVSKERKLHVEMRSADHFRLIWKAGDTVMNTTDVPKKAVIVGTQGDFRYPDLAQAIEREWTASGSHRLSSDPKLDQAVLHTDNSTPFNELVAVMDALYTPKRGSSGPRPVPAFNVSFAVD
jgi:biopolymer transport protein ExbD